MRLHFTKFLKKTFDIREGEVTRALLMQLNIFLIISTLLIVKPTVNALFLAEVGIKFLPSVFLLVAIFAVIISTAYSHFLGRIGLNRIIQTTLIVSVVLFILFGVLLRFNIVGGWILYALYIWVAIFGVLTASQFWIFANVVFNAREAKRLFGFIGAGAISGGIFGGYLTTLLAERVGGENLFFIAATMLAFCIPITMYIWNRKVIPVQSKYQRRKKIARTDHPFQLIRKSKHLTFLAGIIGLSVIVAKLVDYQFNAIASAKISDPDELTAFFGFWFSNFNLISLIVQLLLTRRIVGTLGVGTSLFFLPVFIMIGAIQVFFAPEIWAAIFIKMSDGSLKQSINKAAVELLALPIPSDIKNKTKTFIDVVIDSLATGIAGILLIFFINGLNVSHYIISALILLMTSVWLVLVFRIRISYLNLFKIRLHKVDQIDTSELDLKNASVIGDLKKVLSDGSENQILYVLNKLNTDTNSQLTGIILKLLNHPSDKVKEASLQHLYFVKNGNFSKEVGALIKIPSQKIKIAAFEYLIAHAGENITDIMSSYLNESDYKIRTAALISLAEESRDNPALKQVFKFEERLEKQYNDLRSLSNQEEIYYQKIGLVTALGYSKIPKYFDWIEHFFSDPNVKVSQQSIISAGLTMHPHFIPRLISFLGQKDKEESAIHALINYGKEIVYTLTVYVKKEAPGPDILQNILIVVEKFDLQLSADFLFTLLDNDHSEVRANALKSLNYLKTNSSHLNFHIKEVTNLILDEAKLFQDMLSILYVQTQTENKNPSEAYNSEKSNQRTKLIHLVEVRLDETLERIFRLLGLKYPPEEVMPVLHTIQSKKPDLRSNALEYLDNLLDTSLKKILIPIVETALLDSISEEAIRNLDIKIPNEMECYKFLITRGDEEIQSAVRVLLKELNIKGLA